jgi:DNA-directed RNA polymerase subunit RPC12/RpoP
MKCAVCGLELQDESDKVHDRYLCHLCVYSVLENVRYVDFVHAVEEAQQERAADGARPRCTVCGTTNHHVSDDGRVVQNPPRR